MIVVVMGVAGAGKTRVGSALAQSLGWPFFDADDYHSEANVARMAAGVPLSDQDREPWLRSLQQLVASLDDAVIACSALRADFRQRLASAGNDVVFVHLRVDRALAEQRARTRSGHFMPAELLASQFEAVEVPADAIEMDGSVEVGEIVAAIRTQLQRGPTARDR